jgi:copper homeostasis protein
MRREIDFAGEAGAAGVVLGILTEEGRIDIERTAYLVECAGSMTVTFHRAFDMSSDALMALEDIISAGATRLLTSGQANSAEAHLIRKLVDTAGNRIIIMPGGGLNERNILEVASTTGASEFHLTGRNKGKQHEIRTSGNRSGHPAMAEEEYRLRFADTELIQRIRRTLEK